MVWFSATAFGNAIARGADDLLQFNRDIRPILSDHCLQCHGPDKSQRLGGVRLDTEEGLFTAVDGPAPVSRGNSAASELWRRITTDDPDQKMPPADFKRPLSAEQTSRLKRWIEQGAAWQPHWAFVRPTRPRVPDADATLDSSPDAGSPQNPIDRFIEARLHREGLAPSPRAAKETLLRRVTLQLAGLPPTPDELDAFVADSAPDAYERVVDRLLASPAYGERMSVPWLDAARYADTSGYQNDGPRNMWRWRDYVIESFNAGKPFDQFSVEQLAGDLLPNATMEQRIATGFNRNHRGNAEGGIIPEEYQVEYVVDRVTTTATVWLGLTLECARCHDHKYDPVSQREFYSLYAFFNNIPEHGRAIKEGNSPPYIPAPTREQAARLKQIEEQLAAALRTAEDSQDDVAAAQLAWEADLQKRLAAGETVSSRIDADWINADGLHARFRLDGDLKRADTPANNTPANDTPASNTSTNSADAVNANNAANDTPAAQFAEGRRGKSLALTGDGPTALGDVGAFEYTDKFSVSVWIRPEATTGTLVSRMTPEDEGDGWYLHLRDGRLQVNLVKRWLDDAIRIETRGIVPVDEWLHVAFTYDGSRRASGVRIYVDGQSVPFDVKLDALNQTFSVKQPLRVGGGHRNYSGQIADVRIYGRELNSDECLVMACDRPIDAIVAESAAERDAAESARVRAYFLDRHAPPKLAEIHRRATRLEREWLSFAESLPTVMVMEEMPEPRETFFLIRGQYDRPDERVFPGVPECLPPLAAASSNAQRDSGADAGAEVAPNRLELARWLVDPGHPLTARVIVNRQWELFFGTGLVKTAEDFGVQGDPPSHPELFDWLAVEFIESGWDLKRLHRSIVTSRTYQQSSRSTFELNARDPENRLLARGPRFRLPAETLRDQALAAAGVLERRIGGPSVRPYQPEGLWDEIATVTDYEQSHGADLYRRGMYTYWKRTVAAPVMLTFDATARETCTVRRSRTNTPLQALNLMNDVAFVEAARLTAERVLRDGGRSSGERLRFAFRLLASRLPDDRELTVLRRGLDRHIAHFRNHKDEAARLVAFGESLPDQRLDPAELAAYTAVVNLLLNLDEVVTCE